MVERSTLIAAMRRHAAARGNSPACTFVRYNRDPRGVATTWTYAELDARARSVAAELQGTSAQSAAILCRQGLDYVAAFLGCLYGGVRAVPLYAPKASRDNVRLARLLAEAAPDFMLTTSDALPTVERFVAAEPRLARSRSMCVDRVDPASAAAWRPPAATADTVAYLQYTSGSTADPRGVMVTHANIAHTVEQCVQAYELGSHTRSVSWLPFFHDMGLAAGITVPLFLGLHTLSMAPFAFVQHPVRWLRSIDRHRGTFTAAPNFALDQCVDRMRDDELQGVDLSCLQVLLTGGEPVRARTLRRFTQAFSPYGFRHTMHAPSYGQSEVTVLIAAAAEPSVLTCDRAALAEGMVVPVVTGSPNAQEIVAAGVPAGQRVAIVEPVTQRELGDDRVGEVWVHGPNVAAGYHNRPEQTRATFRARLQGEGERQRAGGRGDEWGEGERQRAGGRGDEWGEGERQRAGGRGPKDADGSISRLHWLRTGDLGFMHGGTLYVTGRLKDILIIDGRNHHPVDIEATVEAADARLLQGRVVAFGVDDGEEKLVVVAEIDRQAVKDAGWDEAALRRAVLNAVATRHGVEVSDLLLVRKGSLRRTSNGKLARGACRRRYLDGVYPTVTGRRDRGYPAVAGRRRGERSEPVARDVREIERWLAARVADDLGLTVADIDPDRVLADYGFSSKDAVAFTGEVERRYAIRVSPTLFWEHPTIRAVSEHLAAPATDTPVTGSGAGAFEDLLRTVEEAPTRCLGGK